MRLEQVLDAVETAEVLVLQYRKLDAPRAARYTVEPHSVHMQGASVYVVGWARERNAPRIFLLDRIEKLERTHETFTRREGLGPGVFAQGAFGLWDGPDEVVRLRFKGSAARIVAEQEFHPTQQLTWNDDGSMTLEMKVPVSPSLRAWVRSFGKRVVLVAPSNLLEEL
ncbi:MAG: WYL domain-containing protein [Archangium sp.]|nr:WYL domain-containing protein [Archangium sp.]